MVANLLLLIEQATRVPLRLLTKWREHTREALDRRVRLSCKSYKLESHARSGRTLAHASFLPPAKVAASAPKG